MLGRGNAGADAGDHFIGKFGLLKSQRLFAASAKDSRIAPLETHDPEALARAVDQELMNLFLLLLVGILALSNADQLAAGGRFLQQRTVQKIVINNDLRASHSLKPLHCDQTGLAPRADDPHFSVHCVPLLLISLFVYELTAMRRYSSYMRSRSALFRLIRACMPTAERQSHRNRQKIPLSIS